MELISVVVPCYNEQESLSLFYPEIVKIAEEMSIKNDLDFEFLFVDDGSKDDTLKILRDLSVTDKRVRYISFSRNFGKESAMFAGLENAKGDYVVIMDADLQHPPRFIPEMYGYVSSGEYDCASTRRISRKGEPKLKSFLSNKFYDVINKISDTEIVNGAQDFRFMTRQMVDAILEMKEYNRFSKGIFSWVGFKTKYLPYENVERVAGTTKWSIWKLFRYSLEGIMGFSTAPLAISMIMGILFCAVAVILAIVYLILILATDMVAAQFPTILCCLFLIGGIQLICTGILGEYLSKAYTECKKRPIYLVRETEDTKRKR